MSKPTKQQIDDWFDESRAAGRIPYRHLDALDLCRQGGVLEQFADAFLAGGTSKLESPIDDEIGEAYAEGWNASTANNEFYKHRDAILAVGRFIRSRSGAVLPSTEEIAIAWFGGDEASPAVRASAKTFVEPAERVRALFDRMLGGSAGEQDQPVADPAERARLVARELRKRGMHARLSESGCDVLSTASGQFYCLLDDARPEWTSKGPRAIADEIQREEDRRARAWAGDE